LSNTEYVRIPDAARRIGLTPREVYQHIEDGHLQVFRDKDGLVVVTAAALADLRGE